MKHLQQAEYEDDNGRAFPADKVDALAAYTYIADGFYNWACGLCGNDNADRWHKVSGRVLKCGSCHKMNLLVRTDCTLITDAVVGKFKSEARDLELVRLKDIEKYNKEQLLAIKQRLLTELSITINQMLGL